MTYGQGCPFYNCLQYNTDNFYGDRMQNSFNCKSAMGRCGNCRVQQCSPGDVREPLQSFPNLTLTWQIIILPDYIVATDTIVQVKKAPRTVGFYLLNRHWSSTVTYHWHCQLFTYFLQLCFHRWFCTTLFALFTFFAERGSHRIIRKQIIVNSTRPCFVYKLVQVDT